MIQGRSQAKLGAWLERVRASLVASFANGITRDRAAVSVAITREWSNGQTGRQITKLKLVKRQMYRRGKLDLLQARRQLTSDAPKLRQSQNCKPNDSLGRATASNRQGQQARCRRPFPDPCG